MQPETPSTYLISGDILRLTYQRIKRKASQDRTRSLTDGNPHR